MHKIKELSAQLNVGLISEREYLGGLIQQIGLLYSNSSEGMQGNSTVAWLSKQLKEAGRG